MTKKIVQRNSRVLRQIAVPVKVEDIDSDKIAKILQDMNEALDACFDGVAIAAPQISVPLRIFTVSGKALPKRGNEWQPNQVYINPVIKKIS
ncbi:MAG: peptide deformylase, partial [Patescibacteria group bacterium]